MKMTDKELIERYHRGIWFFFVNIDGDGFSASRASFIYSYSKSMGISKDKRLSLKDLDILVENNVLSVNGDKYSATDYGKELFGFLVI